MAEAITINRLGPDDLQALLSVPEGLFDNPILPDQARAFLGDPQCVLFLGYDGGRAVAMASGTILRHPDKQPALFINEVGVRESHQRRGIGKAITRAIIAYGREAGCKGIWLGTEADNEAAIALYRALEGEEEQGVFFGWDNAF